jgi:hypothetical protein
MRRRALVGIEASDTLLHLLVAHLHELDVHPASRVGHWRDHLGLGQLDVESLGLSASLHSDGGGGTVNAQLEALPGG